MRTHRHGLVLGKFYPPHAGHHHLIRTAANHCDQLTVLVEAAQVESIPLADRVAWLTAEHADDTRITVIGVHCDSPTDVHDPTVWAAQVAIARAALHNAQRPPVDAVFSSEKYGDELAARLGAACHVQVDADRITIPLSATKVRANLAAHWFDLAPATRAGLSTRVVLVGAESTGTTTISRALADRFRARGGVWASTQWVAEYGRAHSEAKYEALREDAHALGQPTPTFDQVPWGPDDFTHIAAEQTRRENRAAASSSPLLVCDTDAFATALWERRYLGSVSRDVAHLASQLPPRSVYLITDHVGVPFVQDGTRDGEHVRPEMTSWFIEELTAVGHSWVLLTGSEPERLALAERVADQMLTQRATFHAPLG